LTKDDTEAKLLA